MDTLCGALRFMQTTGELANLLTALLHLLHVERIDGPSIGPGTCVLSRSRVALALVLLLVRREVVAATVVVVGRRLSDRATEANFF